MSLTKKDIEELGKVVEKKLEDHKPVFECPNGVTPEMAQGMKEIVGLINSGKKTATKVIVTAFILGIIGLVIKGFWASIMNLFK